MPEQTPTEYVEDDGLHTPEVRAWAEEKYRIVELYDTLFSSGIKKKWDCRVYIDLFAAAGHAKIKGTNRIVRGSPLIALGVPDRFDKYIFCEKDQERLNALKSRVQSKYASAVVEFVEGDCNSKVQEILDKIPPHSSRNKVLSFCFIDPYKIGALQFQTVSALSKKFMDFLIVLAVGMDATRNEAVYTDPRNYQIQRFLGVDNWRAHWKVARTQKILFRHFLAREYASQMETLSYLPVPLEKMKEVRSDDKNLPLYHLAFFSRHELGYTFWEQVLKYSSDQQSLNI